MAIKGRDKEFRLPKVSYVDYKHIEIDRTLLNLFPRLKFNGFLGRARVRVQMITVEKFLEDFKDDKYRDKFRGFSEHEDIVRKWLETDILDLVNRGRLSQAVVSPRPLHGNTYKFRNTKHARDYSTSEQLYWMLNYARNGLGQAACDDLKSLLFEGLDINTDQILTSSKIDVETQAILHLDSQVKDEAESKHPERYPPLCVGQGDLLADDVLRLLAYKSYMPRSVLIEYLKILFSFHLGLYHLRLLKLLPTLVRRQGGDPICAMQSCPMQPKNALPHGACPHRIGIVVDMVDRQNPHMSELARRSAEAHYRRIPPFIQAMFITKKLDEMASYLCSINKMAQPASGFFAVGDVLQLLQSARAQDRENYFQSRLANLIESSGSDGALDPETKRVTEMGLGAFETYIEILVALRGRFHREYLTRCLDSLLLKNSDARLLSQSRAKGSPRSFTLGSRLLEVLLQVAVLSPKGASFQTREIRVEDLLSFLRERYGLFIDRLPADDGFSNPSIIDREATRRNVETFKTRLREIGFFQDLSDAYVTQTVTPRYTILG